MWVEEPSGPVAFVDLDQDSKLPANAWADTILASRGLKAELAIRKMGGRVAVFYDTNADGRFDRVHLQAPKGKIEAFEIAPDDTMKKLEGVVALIGGAQVIAFLSRPRCRPST